MSDDAFQIIPHPRERVLEVIYPARITVVAFENYEAELRSVIEQFKAAAVLSIAAHA